jgi:hypothetical protein
MCRLCDLLPDMPQAARCICMAAIIIAVVAVIIKFIRIAHMAVRDHFTINQTIPVMATVDGMKYRVHGGHSDPRAAANLLAQLNRRTTDLLRWMRKRYIGAPGVPPAASRHEMTRARMDAVQNLLARYNPDNLAENSPLDVAGDSSYCLDKGAVIALCLRTKAKPAVNGRPAVAAGELHDLDTLIFVTLHEIAHAAIEEIDHPPKFWSTFKFLLDEAEISGIYYSRNYERSPVDYCGVHVDYNPKFDRSLPSI